MAFAARMQTKKQKTITKSLPTTECAMEVGGVEMTTFSSWREKEEKERRKKERISAFFFPS